MILYLPAILIPCLSTTKIYPSFPKFSNLLFVGYGDASRATDLQTSQSVTDSSFCLAFGAIAFKSKLQSTITTSKAEGGFVAAVLATNSAKYVGSIIIELSVGTSKFTTSQSKNGDNAATSSRSYGCFVVEACTVHCNRLFCWLRSHALVALPLIVLACLAVSTTICFAFVLRAISVCVLLFLLLPLLSHPADLVCGPSEFNVIVGLLTALELAGLVAQAFDGDAFVGLVIFSAYFTKEHLLEIRLQLVK